MQLVIYIIILILLLYLISHNNSKKIKELFNNSIDTILDKPKHKFPFRYFKDENNNILPIVALTAFFRNSDDVELYNNYINANIKVIGVTAYKTFPLKIRDISEDKYHLNNNFDYTNNIKLWLACMKNLELYNFTSEKNITIDISESDFYDIDTNPYETKKKYDFIYICNKDDDNCPREGWNAINRNYDLALKCFPIMINEYNLKGLCVGRIGCNDLNIYKDNLTITDYLPYHELQIKINESKFLFVPNIYDASPRVVAESLIKNVPVLMNQNIICGFKYINKETGEFFIDQNNIRNGLDSILYKINNKIISPKKWWSNNYGYKISSKKLRDFLNLEYPDILQNINNVSFII